MKQIYSNLLMKSLLGVAGLLVTTACSDDHFDVQAAEGSAAKNIYELIKENKSTTDFAKIMSRTYVMKNDHDYSAKKDSVCYSDILAGSQFYTVWAPENEDYEASKYLQMLDRRDQLLSQNPAPNSADFKEAWELNYRVATQFVLNHVARFNYASNMEPQRVRLMNNKVSVYNAGENKFGGKSMGDLSYGANNGTLHFLKGVNPFSYSIYEYLEVAPEFSKLRNYLFSDAINKRVFSEQLSVPGAMNNEGNMVYVDSVYVTTNDVLNSSRAAISSEDSCYVTVLPSDECWDEAVRKVGKLYDYGPSYAYEWDKAKAEFNMKGDKALRFDQDSLKNLRAKAAIIGNVFFSTSQFSVPNNLDSTLVNSYAQTHDSLKSANRMMIYKPTTSKINPIFCGKDLSKAVTPKRASNGYIYPVDAYNFDPALTFASHKQYISLLFPFSIASTQGDLSAQGNNATHDGELINLSSEDRNDSVKGKMTDNFYRYFEVSGNNKMTLYFALNGVYSMKYRITADILPNCINKAKIRHEVDKKTGEEVEVVEHTRFKCEIRDDQNKLVAKSGVIEVNPDTIMTYELIPEVTFEKSYAGLPQNYTSFPTLQIVMSPIDQKKGNSKAISIQAIRIEPIEE